MRIYLTESAFLEGTMAAQERLLLVEGKNIQPFGGGEGPPLLYLHDAGAFWWMPVHDPLARSCHLYLPVHPGFGNSKGEKMSK